MPLPNLRTFDVDIRGLGGGGAPAVRYDCKLGTTFMLSLQTITISVTDYSNVYIALVAQQKSTQVIRKSHGLKWHSC